ncbi:hypothetical protein TURU_163410 [Turdus rufiventris]|nr:hypothetical protein TURU_163410 [Turdus rufiventris]
MCKINTLIFVVFQREKLIHELEEERHLRLESEKRLREVTLESERSRAQMRGLQEQFSRIENPWSICNLQIIDYSSLLMDQREINVTPETKDPNLYSDELHNVCNRIEASGIECLPENQRKVEVDQAY